jgi:hypothetical protein
MPVTIDGHTQSEAAANTAAFDGVYLREREESSPSPYLAFTGPFSLSLSPSATDGD